MSFLNSRPAKGRELRNHILFFINSHKKNNQVVFSKHHYFTHFVAMKHLKTFSRLSLGFQESRWEMVVYGMEGAHCCTWESLRVFVSFILCWFKSQVLNPPCSNDNKISSSSSQRDASETLLTQRFAEGAMIHHGLLLWWDYPNTTLYHPW